MLFIKTALISVTILGKGYGQDDLCTSHHNLQCYGDDLKDSGAVSTDEECCERCTALAGCKAWTWNWNIDQHCWLKDACNDKRTGYDYHSGFDSSPSPSPPTPTPGPTPGGVNPLNIVPNSERSKNYFFIIGDWGAHSDKTKGCQEKIATMMRDYVQKNEDSKLLFVLAVGDNFYYTGLGNPSTQFQDDWKNIYDSITDVPWLAVYGNHDHGNSDPGCACDKGCNQFNNGYRPEGTNNFWIPDYYWYYSIPDVSLEVVGLDTNGIDVNGLGGDGCANGAKETCNNCGGYDNVSSFLNKKKREGETFMYERARSTDATTVAIIQHYPNDEVAKDYKTNFETQNENKAKVLSAFGHTHDQVCYGHDENDNCNVILTGGGGGYIDHGQYLGFTAVHLKEDGGFSTVLESSDVRIERGGCSWFNEKSADIGDFVQI